MLLAFGSDKFKILLAGQDDDGLPSPFMIINSTFIHFIIVQISSLFFALIGLAWGFKVGPYAFFGFTVFIYALATAVAAALAILRLTEWFDDFVKNESRTNNQN